MVASFCKFALIIILFVITSLPACQAKNFQEIDLKRLMASKAISTNTPTFVSREVFNSTVNKEGHIYLSNVPLEWSVIGGFQVLHVAYENLENMSSLGQKNERVLFGIMGKKDIPEEKIKSDSLGASPKSLRGSLSYTCSVKPKLEGNFTSRFTMTSGKGITHKEGCRMLAWASAAHGIEFVVDPQNADTIIVREVSSVQFGFKRVA